MQQKNSTIVFTRGAVKRELFFFLLSGCIFTKHEKGKDETKYDFLLLLLQNCVSNKILLQHPYNQRGIHIHTHIH